MQWTPNVLRWRDVWIQKLKLQNPRRSAKLSGQYSIHLGQLHGPLHKDDTLDKSRSVIHVDYIDNNHRCHVKPHEHLWHAQTVYDRRGPGSKRQIAVHRFLCSFTIQPSSFTILVSQSDRKVSQSEFHNPFAEFHNPSAEFHNPTGKFHNTTLT